MQGHGHTRRRSALSELRELNQWVCWKYGAVRPNGKREKVPIHPATGRQGDAFNPETWGSYSDAVVGEVIHSCDGIGFVLTEDDPYCAVDLDEVIDPATGIIHEDAQAIVNGLDTYWEVSPSYAGLRGILKGTKPGTRSRTTAPTGIEVELYDRQRFVTITGLSIAEDEVDNAIRELQRTLDVFYEWLFPQDTEGTDVLGGADFPGTDEELLTKARNVGQWKMFRKLYVNGKWWEDFKSQSEADLKLCTMLAFWCGHDEGRIDRLFRRSRLMRDKWDERRGHSTYGGQTIAKAIEICPYFYRAKVEVTDEVQATLHQLHTWKMVFPWNYRGGPTDRHVYCALLVHAAEHGTEHPEGITMSMGTRDLAVEARVGSRNTVDNAIKRLAEMHDAVEVLTRGYGRRATRFLLKVGSAQECAIKNTGYVYGPGLSARIRNFSSNTSTIGKRNAQILDIIFNSNTPVPLDELARVLSVERSRNLKRNLALLEERGLIEEVDGVYVTPPDFEERLERELEVSGCNAAEAKQRARVEREKEAYHYHRQPKANDAAAIGELATRRALGEMD